MKAHLQTTNQLTQCMGNLMTQTHDLDEISLILGRYLEWCYNIIVTNVVNVVLMALIIKLCIVALVTGETVSLVDVDISQRGRNSAHPPTPPPPPRRSLSLLGETHYRCSHTSSISFIHTFHISICFTLSKYFFSNLPHPLRYIPSHWHL